MSALALSARLLLCGPCHACRAHSRQPRHLLPIFRLDGL